MSVLVNGPIESKLDNNMWDRTGMAVQQHIVAWCDSTMILLWCSVYSCQLIFKWDKLMLTHAINTKICLKTRHWLSIKKSFWFTVSFWRSLFYVTTEFSYDPINQNMNATAFCSFVTCPFLSITDISWSIKRYQIVQNGKQTRIVALGTAL